MSFRVRLLTYPDLPQVVAIERRSFPSPWSLAMFVLELSKPSGICLAASSGEDLVGYAICARYDDVYHVMDIAVDPDSRRQGIGKALLAAILERAGEDAGLTLEVRVSNAAAIALYESCGFRGVGTRPSYYADNGEDAIVMWRAVDEPWEPS